MENVHYIGIFKLFIILFFDFSSLYFNYCGYECSLYKHLQASYSNYCAIFIIFSLFFVVGFSSLYLNYRKNVHYIGIFKLLFPIIVDIMAHYIDIFRLFNIIFWIIVDICVHYISFLKLLLHYFLDCRYKIVNHFQIFQTHFLIIKFSLFFHNFWFLKGMNIKF